MANTFALAFKDLDRLLRGDATRLAALRRGHIEIEASHLPTLIIGLGVLYGGCMGCFALANKHFGDALLQTLSAMGKVPLLFGATLLVTFPSLYVLNALVGSRLTLASVWRLLVSSMAVMMAVLASLGPIVAFFSLSTTNYPFMLLLNVVVFAVSGFLGLKFLLHTLHRLTIVLYDNAPAETEDDDLDLTQAPVSIPVTPTAAVASAADDYLTVRPSRDGALDKVSPHAMGKSVRQIFCLWVVAFALVGMQMSWCLRPFVSAPDKPFILFSPRESNFYAAVFDTLHRLLSGS